MIREEFERAMEECLGLSEWDASEQMKMAALWAARWMAERLAQRFDIEGKETYISEDIRQLAKELQ